MFYKINICQYLIGNIGMVKTYGNFIAGKWVASSSDETFESTNPANGKSLGLFQQSNSKDVDLAVSVAKKAFDEWRLVPPPVRGRYLQKVADYLRANKRKYGKFVTLEMGKQLSEGLSDVQEAIDILEYMAGEGRRLFGYTTTSELRDKFAMTLRMPLGPVGLITPWNFPIAIPAWKIAPALICGNTIVFKPSSDTPLTAIEFVKIFERVGIPKGVINLVTGSGKDVGTPLVKHKDIRGISFTGSVNTGKFIKASAGLKKIGLELGGKNPIIILEDADLDLAVEGVLWGAFGTTGQRCTAASRVIVHEKIKDAFEKKLLEKVKNLDVGNGLTCDVGPLVNKSALEKVKKYVKLGRKEGKLLYGGDQISGKGFFHEPTIFTEVKPNAKIAQEEIFGPVLAIISVKNLDEAIKVANSITYGLSSSIYTQDVNLAFKAMRDVEAGVTYINSSTIGSEVHLPFGGVKETGGTREAGIEGINEFSETKTVYIDFSGKLQKAQMKNED